MAFYNRLREGRRRKFIQMQRAFLASTMKRVGVVLTQNKKSKNAKIIKLAAKLSIVLHAYEFIFLCVSCVDRL